jgi:Holliday junction resolvasome RuvABC endonuclease subunit
VVARGGLLSLDLSRNTGWAYGPPDAQLPALWGCWVLPQRRLGDRLNALRSVFDAFCIEFAPSLVFKEEPLAHYTNDPLHVVREQYGLHGVIEAECADLGLRVTEQPPSTIREEVLGKGQFPKGTVKAVVLRWAEQRGISCDDNDNIADACVGWEFCVRHVLKRELLVLQ